MNLGYYRGLSGSVSRFALSAVLAVSVIGGVGVSFALAGETIRYDDTAESAELQHAPSFVLFPGVLDDLYVGTPTAPSSSDNTVIVDYTKPGLPDPSSVYGGLVENGNSLNNKVFIKNGSVTAAVWGGYVKNTSNSNVTSSDNVVTVSGGRVGIGVYGSWVDDNNNGSNIKVNHNVVTMSGGSSDFGAYGGWVNSNNNNSTITVSNNVVTVNDSSVGFVVYGGTVNNYANNNKITLSDNIVMIHNGSVGILVAGGAGGDNSSARADSIIVTGNRVEISGNSVAYNVLGGVVTATDGLAINNTVSLIGDQITLARTDNGVTTYGSIWGGFIGEDIFLSTELVTDFDKVIKGNTLNLEGYRGTVSGIRNFENYNWILPKNVVNGETLVTIADGGTAVDLTRTKHTVSVYADGNRLKVGDKITMIDKTINGSYGPASNLSVKEGQFVIYDATLSQQQNGSDTGLVLAIDKVHGNSQSKSYSEGRVAALGFLNQGNDLIANAGISKIRSMVLANEKDATRPAVIPFIIANGSSQNYKTGSHVDVRGFNTAMGLATGFTFASGHKATLGAFFEYGRGTYDSFNSFTDYASVHGDGDTDYKGGGIFGRIEFAGTGLGRVTQLTPDQADGLYVEASLRMGRAKSKFAVGSATSDYQGSYDSEATYYGGHVAGGYVFNFDNKQSLDVYGRYLWTHMDSDTVTIANEKLRFDDANSSRIQLGGRYSYAYSDQFQPYIGAAYEYEFDGDIKAKAYEFNLDRPSLKGSTGIFEAGFSFQPLATNKAFNIDVNGQAYAGQRQGGGGGIKLKYQF